MPLSQAEQLEESVEQKLTARNRRRRPRMKVSGKGVLALKKIMTGHTSKRKRA